MSLSPAQISEFKTPLYVYSERVFTEQFNTLHNSLTGIDHLICFAVKANSNLSIIKKFAHLGAGFDIVSGVELRRVTAAGGNHKKIVFAGVGKTDDEIRLGLASDIRFFNVESIDEIIHIESIAKEMSQTARISFRINPNISVDTHPYLATGLDNSKFGIPLDQIPAVYEQFKSSTHLSVVGVDCHIGSQISEIAPFKESLTQLIRIADLLRQAGAPIKTIDLGGGMGVSFSGQYKPLDITEYGAMVKSMMKPTPYSLVVEPGKYLIAEAGQLITKVLYVKKNAAREFLILDAGMNDLMRPALYQAHHKTVIVGQESVIGTHRYDLGGPVCESGCIFSTDELLPEAKNGDFLAICDAGAYGFSMASNYNTRGRPAEVLIELDGTARLIRKREEVRELFEHEKGYL